MQENFKMAFDLSEKLPTILQFRKNVRKGNVENFDLHNEQKIKNGSNNKKKIGPQVVRYTLKKNNKISYFKSYSYLIKEIRKAKKYH